MGFLAPAISIGGSILGGITKARGQQREAQAAEAAALFKAQVARNNAKLAQRAAEITRARGEIEARDALERGAIEELKSARDISRLKGRQAAAFAANGIELGSGAVADVVADTQAAGTLEALTIRDNAARQARSIRLTAQDRALQFETAAQNFISETGLLQAQGAEAEAAGDIASASTFLGTATSVADKWFSFNQEGVF